MLSCSMAESGRAGGEMKSAVCGLAEAAYVRRPVSMPGNRRDYRAV